MKLQTEKLKKSNLVIIVIALLIGLIFLSHHIFIIWDLHGVNKQYYPLVVYNGNYDDILGYAPRVKEFLEGRWLVSDISLYEYKDFPAVFSILNPIVFGILTYICGSLTNLFIVSDFIFPAFTFLVLYYFCYILCKNRLYSVVFGCLILFQYKIGNFLPPINTYRLKMLISMFLPKEYVNRPLEFTKYEAPQLIFLPFMLAIIFTLFGMKKDEKKYYILAGLFFGSLFYCYIYSWLYFAISLSFISFYFLLVKRNQFKNILITWGVGIFVSAFYWINYLKLKSLPQYKDIVEGFSIGKGHYFRFFFFKDYIIWILLCVVLWYLGRKKAREAAVLLISMILSGICCLNLQIITGFVPQADHLLTRAVNFGLGFGWLIAIFWGYEFILDFAKGENKNRIRKVFSIISVFLIVISCGYGIVSHWRFSKQHFNEFTISPKLAESLEWLNKNSDKDSVIITLSPVTVMYLLTYTHNNVFVPNSVYTLAPREETRERFIFAAKILSLPQKTIRRMLSSESTDYEHPVNFFLGWHEVQFKEDLNIFLDYPARLKIRDKVLTKFSQYELNVEKIRKKYRADYIFYGPDERRMQRSTFSYLPVKRVFYNGEIEIYKFPG